MFNHPRPNCNSLVTSDRPRGECNISQRCEGINNIGTQGNTVSQRESELRINTQMTKKLPEGESGWTPVIYI
jgi:hypothetical protein